MNAKKSLYSIALLSVATSFYSLSSSTHTNKTFFSFRPHNFNLPLEQTLWYHSKAYHSKTAGGSFQVTPLAQFSSQSKDPGTYLMFNGSNILNIGRNTDIDNRHLKFNETSSSNLSGSIKLKPAIQHYGIRLDYHQDLNHLIDNFSLKISVPFVYATSKPHATIVENPSSENYKTIKDYFSGNVMWSITGQEDETIKLQQPLQFGMIDRPVEKLGIANINFSFEFSAINNYTTFLSLNAHILIPTDTSPKAYYIFEPTIGTADHWALGISANGAFKLGGNFDLLYDARLTYVLPNTERRILGLKNQSGSLLKWGQYNLIGKIGSPYVEPAANMLAQHVKVYPKNHLEALFVLSHHNKGMCIETGYNPFFRQRERLTKETEFNESLYAFVGSDFATDIVSGLPAVASFSVDDSNLSNTIGLINPKGASSSVRGTILSSQIDVTPAEHPAIVTHTFFLSGGYTFDWNEFALTLGLGLSVEIPNNNAGLWQNSIWLKNSIMF
jgi:hypothetical protein